VPGCVYLQLLHGIFSTLKQRFFLVNSLTSFDAQLNENKFSIQPEFYLLIFLMKILNLDKLTEGMPI